MSAAHHGQRDSIERIRPRLAAPAVRDMAFRQTVQCVYNASDYWHFLIKGSIALLVSAAVQRRQIIGYNVFKAAANVCCLGALMTVQRGRDLAEYSYTLDASGQPQIEAISLSLSLQIVFIF